MPAFAAAEIQPGRLHLSPQTEAHRRAGAARHYAGSEETGKAEEARKTEEEELIILSVPTLPCPHTS